MLTLNGGIVHIHERVVDVIDNRIKSANQVYEPASRQIKDKVNQAKWRQDYANAKLALRKMQSTKVIDQAALDQIDELFNWEIDVARVGICKIDKVAAKALLPLLDGLRDEGIYILSRGAVEDYYPDEASKSGSKPERALGAIELVKNKGDVLALSDPLDNGRPPELLEIFSSIFSGL